MLIIRPEQLDALEQKSRQAFLEKLQKALRSEHPELTQGIEPEPLKQQLTDIVARGRTYGLVLEADCCEFAALSLRWGAGFEQKPPHLWAGEILRAPQGEPGQKLAKVKTRLLELTSQV